MTYKSLYLARRNPSIEIEDWPRTWRSHAVFASQFPVMEAKLHSLFYCCRVTNPSLDSQRLDLPEISTEHDGVAVVSSADLNSLIGSLVSAEDQLRIEEDELRVFGIHVQGNLAFACKERLLLPGPQGKAAIFHFPARKPGLSREQFSARWNGAHAEIETATVSGSNGITRLVHNELVRDPPALLPFDGISETWFATQEDALRWLVDGTRDVITSDLPEFCDIERSVTMLTRVCHSWQQD